MGNPYVHLGRDARFETKSAWQARTVRKGAIAVGQDGILRGDWQSPRVPVANWHAACQAVAHGPAAHGSA
jgi:hypothetical protein